MNINIENLSVAELMAAYKDGTLKPAQVTGDCLARIKEHPEYFTTVMAEEALATALGLETALAGGPEGSLAGLPVAIEDNICTLGPTMAGTAFLKDYVSPLEASAVTKLREAGAVIVGKTMVNELALDENCPTSGAAEAMAAGCCRAALISEINGAGCLAAAFKGVLAMTPSFGLVSRFGLINPVSSMGRIAIMTKSVKDASHLFNVILGNDGRDASMRTPNGRNVSELLAHDTLKGLKVALPAELLNVAEPRAKLVYKAAHQLEEQGAEVVKISLPALNLAPQIYRIISAVEAMSSLNRFNGFTFGDRQTPQGGTWDDVVAATRAEGFGPKAKQHILDGFFFSAAGNYEKYYLQAARARRKLCNELEGALSAYSLIMAPPAVDEPEDFASAVKDGDLFKNNNQLLGAALAGVSMSSYPYDVLPNGRPGAVSIWAQPLNVAPAFMAAAHLCR